MAKQHLRLYVIELQMGEIVAFSPFTYHQGYSSGDTILKQIKIANEGDTRVYGCKRTPPLDENCLYFQAIKEKKLRTTYQKPNVTSSAATIGIAIDNQRSGSSRSNEINGGARASNIESSDHEMELSPEAPPFSSSDPQPDYSPHSPGNTVPLSDIIDTNDSMHRITTTPPTEENVPKSWGKLSPAKLEGIKINSKPAPSGDAIGNIKQKQTHRHSPDLTDGMQSKHGSKLSLTLKEVQITKTERIVS